MPNKRANVKNEKQYEALKDKGMSKERAARIANSPGRLEPRWQEVGVRLELEPGRHHRPEEGGRPQGRQGFCAEVLRPTLPTGQVHRR